MKKLSIILLIISCLIIAVIILFKTNSKQKGFIYYNNPVYQDLEKTNTTSITYNLYQKYMQKEKDAASILKMYDEMLLDNYNDTFAIIDILTYKGKILAEQQDYEMAIKIYTEIITTYNNYSQNIVEALYSLGILYWDKNSDSALVYLNKVMDTAETESFNYYRTTEAILDIKYEIFEKKILEQSQQLISQIDKLIKHRFSQNEPELLRLHTFKYNIFIKNGDLFKAKQEKKICEQLLSDIDKNKNISPKDYFDKYKQKLNQIQFNID